MNPILLFVHLIYKKNQHFKLFNHVLSSVYLYFCECIFVIRLHIMLNTYYAVRYREIRTICLHFYISDYILVKTIKLIFYGLKVLKDILFIMK